MPSLVGSEMCIRDSGAPEPGASPPDLDRFAGESMRGVVVGFDTTKKPGFNLQNVACFRWKLLRRQEFPKFT